jgi:hypothetical protein
VNKPNSAPQILFTLSVILAPIVTGLPAPTRAQEPPGAVSDRVAGQVYLADSGVVLDGATTYRVQVSVP